MTARSKFITGVAVLTASLAMTVAGRAADMALRGSLPVHEDSGPNWTGVYGGVHGGIGSMTADTQAMARREAERLLNGLYYLNPTAGVAAPTFINVDPVRGTPVMFGVFAGYQAQFEDAVIGFEVDYNRIARGGGGSRTWTQPFAVLYAQTGFTDAFSQSTTVRASLTDYFTARLRAGWAYGRVMPYMTAGLAIARGNTSVSYQAGYERIDTDAGDAVDWTQAYGDLVNSTRASNGVIGFGFALGTGVEALITNNIFARAEYQYLRIPSLGGVPVTLHAVRAGVGIKY
ncbi:MAG: outer membrane protein [Phreatobacter sp.]|uniref:outer membrane protein n=1 Tax=Phreatobacter sp. TaxID=1966341 RepID=UPI0040351ECF